MTLDEANALLLPCPFCGHGAKIIQGDVTGMYSGNGGFMIRHDDESCGVNMGTMDEEYPGGPCSGSISSIDDAISEWNRRSQS
jgi:hypothetical protein